MRPGPPFWNPLDTANSKAQEITATAEKKAEVLRSENNKLTAENDTLRKDKESYSKKNDVFRQTISAAGVQTMPLLPPAVLLF